MNRAEPIAPQDETRCTCGRLLARLTDAGIELKCPRCRSVVVIGWSAVRDERSRPGARD
jgi:phage FluMu protein Com